ncbi:unnamed protein product [Calypogeia fissa]
MDNLRIRDTAELTYSAVQYHQLLLFRRLRTGGEGGISEVGVERDRDGGLCDDTKHCNIAGAGAWLQTQENML